MIFDMPKNDSDLKTLKCFSKDPHEPHIWTFLYDNPLTDYSCPGKDEPNE